MSSRLKSLMGYRPSGMSTSRSDRLEQLFDSKDAIVDIIFIACFASDQGKTRRGLESLQPTLRKARMLTFEYDSSIMVERDSIRSCSQDLLKGLERHRKASKTVDDRPIIFAAHGLGGFVCQEAIVLSKRSTAEHVQRIYHSTKGIAFLDTPHGNEFDFDQFIRAGIRAGNFRIPPDRASGHAAEALVHIRGDFDAITKSQLVKVSHFSEENLVPDTSTRDPMPSTNSNDTLREDPINHADIAKFVTRDDSNVIGIVDELERWIQLESP